MNRNAKRILSMVLAMLMLASMMCMSVSAARVLAVTKLDATVTEPVAGETPDYEAEFDAKHVAITQVIWWVVEDDTTATAMKPGDTFVEGRTYECDVRFQISDENALFTENVAGTVNGATVETYTHDSLKVCTLYSYFVCKAAEPDVKVIFTEDSKAECSGVLEVDVEAMAELSETFMEAYFTDGVDCCWYVDGVALAEYTDCRLELTEDYCGKTVYVDVFYDTKKVTSETFTIAHYEAPHICEYDFENPDMDTATCENDGVYIFECLDPDCDNTSTRPSAAKGHSFSEWEETVEADCTNDGEKERVCSECYEVETDVIPSFGGHTNDDEDSVCDVCGTPVKNSSSDDEASNDEQDPLNDFYVGDVDLDGKVTIKDATMIQKALADILTLSYESETLADVDRNGKITIKDATAIQKYLVGIESGTAVGILLGEVKG